MLEIAYGLASVSTALLIVAMVAWVKLYRGPDLQRLNGGGAVPHLGKAEVASQLLVLAFGLSVVAAILAIAGWFST